MVLNGMKNTFSNDLGNSYGVRSATVYLCLRLKPEVMYRLSPRDKKPIKVGNLDIGVKMKPIRVANPDVGIKMNESGVADLNVGVKM